MRCQRVRPALLAGHWTNVSVVPVRPIPGRPSPRPFPNGAFPNHSFHVLGVISVRGLLRSGVVSEPLHVLDRCRFGGAKSSPSSETRLLCSLSHLSGTVIVLVLGAVRDEVAVTGEGTMRLSRHLAAGDWCSLHWDWVCDRLEPAQMRSLRAFTPRRSWLLSTTLLPSVLA